MKRIINVADRASSRSPNTSDYWLCAAGRRYSCVRIEVQSSLNAAPFSAVTSGSPDILENHGRQFCIAVARVASRQRAIGRAVIPSPRDIARVVPPRRTSFIRRPPPNATKRPQPKGIKRSQLTCRRRAVTLPQKPSRPEAKSRVIPAGINTSHGHTAHYGMRRKHAGNHQQN